MSKELTYIEGNFHGSNVISTIANGTGRAYSTLTSRSRETAPQAPDFPRRRQVDTTQSRLKGIKGHPFQAQVSWLPIQPGRCCSKCNCTCHKPPPSKGSMPQHIRCTEMACRKSKSREIRLRLRSSKYLKKEWILFLLQRGLRFYLQVKSRPIIPDTSDAMRFALNGDFLALKNLIVSGRASIFDTAPDGWGLLHTSAYHSQFEITRFLLQCGADEDVAEVKSRKPSHFAKFKALSYKASREQIRLAKVFSNHDDFREDFELSPILSSTLGEYASSDSEKPSLQRVLWFATLLCVNSPNVEWNSCKIRYRDRSPLFLELIDIFEVGYKRRESRFKTFHTLLEQPDSIQFWSPVLWAAFMGKEWHLKTLLESGANPFYITPSRRNLYHHAAESGNNAVVRYVLRQGYHSLPGGVDINLADYWLETPLHIATEHSEDMITSYLQHGANPLAIQMDGEIPLHYIGRYNDGNRLNCLNASLAIFPPHSPAINTQNNIGWTPLFHALDSSPCVGKLLQWGANPHITDEKGKNVLHHACELNYASSLSVLLDHTNEDTVNAKDDEGNTPLFVAFDNSSLECARIILRRCRVWDTSDGQGRSPVQLATDAGDDVCLRLALSIAGVDKGDVTKLNRKGKPKL